MEAVAFYTAMMVFATTVSALTLCAAVTSKFQHRSALWLTVCMVGVSAFALVSIVIQLEGVAPGSLPLGPNGVALAIHALASVLVAVGLPRFVVASFRGTTNRPTAIVLLGVALAVAALSILRVVRGWHVAPENDPVAFTIRIINFAIIGGSLGSVLVFQSRLPDRGLFRTVLTQLSALVLLLPLLYIEDVGAFRVPGFPHLTGQILMASVAVSVILHTSSLSRPRFVSEDSVSDYFVSHFQVSPREKDVVESVLRGLDSRAIAEELFISHRTVEKHLSNVYQKTGVANRIQLYNLLRAER